MIRISEIYTSLQGESTFCGVPCLFIRMAGCNLRCSYCDSVYALHAEQELSVKEILERVQVEAARWSRQHLAGHLLPIVEVTGGEPLVQKETPELLARLCDCGFTVLLETNGSIALEGLDERVHKIVDMKVPSSGESDQNRVEILDKLSPRDEIKFVIGSQEDYQWVNHFLTQRPDLASRCTVLISWFSLEAAGKDSRSKPVPPGHHPISRTELADAILRDKLPARMQVQLHKILWPQSERGK